MNDSIHFQEMLFIAFKPNSRQTRRKAQNEYVLMQNTMYPILHQFLISERNENDKNIYLQKFIKGARIVNKNNVFVRIKENYFEEVFITRQDAVKSYMKKPTLKKWTIAACFLLIIVISLMILLSVKPLIF